MGRKRSKSSSSSTKSFFSMLFRFSGRPQYSERDLDEVQPRHRGKVYWASDEDRGRWVGEPDIDRKATEFIVNFKNRVAAYEV